MGCCTGKSGRRNVKNVRIPGKTRTLKSRIPRAGKRRQRLATKRI